MKNIIVNIKDDNYLYEKYNDNVSKELIEYLINETKRIQDNIKIVVKTNIEVDEIEYLIKEGL